LDCLHDPGLFKIRAKKEGLFADFRRRRGLVRKRSFGCRHIRGRASGGGASGGGGTSGAGAVGGSSIPSGTLRVPLQSGPVSGDISSAAFLQVLLQERHLPRRRRCRQIIHLIRVFRSGRSPSIFNLPEFAFFTVSKRATRIQPVEFVEFLVNLIGGFGSPDFLSLDLSWSDP